MMRRFISAAAAVGLVAAGGVILPSTSAGAASPTTVYVSKTGSDSNDCTAATGSAPVGPCLTIAHAVSLVGQSGVAYTGETVDYSSVSTISVAAGSYSEENPITINTAEPLEILGAGAPPAVTVEPANGSASLFEIGTTDSGSAADLADLVLQGPASTPGTLPVDGGAVYNLATGPAGTAGVTLSDTTITGFAVSGDGGGVFSGAGSSLLTNDGTTISGNSAAQGGGFAAEGTRFVLDGGTISGNTTTGGDGGGLYALNSEAIIDPGTTFTGNAAHDGNGGGAAIEGSSVSGIAYTSCAGVSFPCLQVTSAVFSGNTADNDGGGGGNGGGLDVDAVGTGAMGGDFPTFIATSEFGGNVANAQAGGGPNATGGEGGAIYGSIDNGEHLEISGSDLGDLGNGTADPNIAGSGGGIYNANGDVHVSSSYIHANEARPANAAVTSGGFIGGGGGVYSGAEGSFTLVGSTVSGNQSTGDGKGDGDGGGVYSDGVPPLAIIDSTIADNTVTGDAGGGVDVQGNGPVRLDDATIVGNVSVPDGGGGAGGGVSMWVPEGVVAHFNVEATGSIIAGNGVGPLAATVGSTSIPVGDTLANCNIALQGDEGDNLEDDAGSGAEGCGFSGGHIPADIVGQPAGLGALQDDAGAPVATIPVAVPATGSPALESGGSQCDGLDGDYTDEVGEPRPTSGCDIGSVQPGAQQPGGGGGGSGGGGSTPTTTIPPTTTTIPPPVGPAITRIGGANRVDTAVLASQAEFPDGGAGAVVLARDDEFPDALTGVPLAVTMKAPLLLSGPDTLDAETAAEIQRVLPPGATVYLLGGPAALGMAVEAQVTALGYQVERVAGPTRYATAIAVAKLLGVTQNVVEVDGTDFADAASAGPAAVAWGGAVLLTDGSLQDPATAAFLAEVDPARRFAIGGPAAAADPAAAPLVGADRYATAALVARKFFPLTRGIGVATGLDFPDALTGGIAMATVGEPLLLAAPTFTSPEALPPSLSAYLSTLSSTLDMITVFGGTAAVSQAVAATLQQAAD
jgi:putative cell wall-binding protein